MLKMWETFFFNFLELFFILVHVPLTNEQKQKKSSSWPRYREIDLTSFVQAKVCQGQLTEIFEKDNEGSSCNFNEIPTSNHLCIKVLVC